ncbi:MAG: metalloregulator ArsR/SmtB family transcription factor [Alphaproteobacteria bacterium]
MERTQIIEALNALAQETRLELFRLIVGAGPAGLTPSAMSRQLKIAPPTLSFHLGRLSHAGLIVPRRRGRSIGYSAHAETVEALLAVLATSLRPPPPKDEGSKEAAPSAPKDSKPLEATEASKVEPGTAG